MSYPIISGAEPWSQRGTGPNASTGIILSHGFTGNPCSMRWLGMNLAERGFTVDVIRLPGHGTHWKDMAQTRYSDWRAEVNRAVDRVRPEVDRLFLVGLSMGGTLTVDVGWEREADLDGLVSINAAFLDRPGLLAKVAPLISKVIPAFPAKVAGLAENDMAREGEDENAYDMVPGQAADSMLSALPRIRRQLSRTGIPVLVAYSPQDHSVDPANSKAILEAVGDRGRELVLPNSYHLATMDLDRELLADTIVDFVSVQPKSVSAAASP